MRQSGNHRASCMTWISIYCFSDMNDIILEKSKSTYISQLANSRMKVPNIVLWSKGPCDPQTCIMDF